MILFFCSWKNERKIENFGGDCDTRVRIFLLSSFAIAPLPQLRHSRVADHGVLPQSLATASSGIFLFTIPGVLVALLIVTISSWCPFCIENTKCWPSLATIGSNDAQRLSEHFLSHLCPKQRWCFFSKKCDSVYDLYLGVIHLHIWDQLVNRRRASLARWCHFCACSKRKWGKARPV